MSRAAEPLPARGDTLSSGRYALLDLIGEGASAAVYRARDTSLDLQRAVKVLRPSHTRGDDQRRRLRAEARALSELSHPNILRMFDFGAEGVYDFVVMQIADGGSLSELVKERGPLEPALAVDYTLQVLGALAHAHSRGIVHRDVKPQNILLDSEGKALLADFGIALVVDDDTRSTRTGVAMGTMAFMAPEQRLDARSVGPSADIYAVATTLYNLLTDDNPVDLFAANEDSPRWRGIDPRIVAVIQHAVRYDPETRYQNADAMYAELLKAREDLTTAVPPPLPLGPSVVVDGSHLTGVTLAPGPEADRAVWPWVGAAVLIVVALLFALRPGDRPEVAGLGDASLAEVAIAPTPEPTVAPEPTSVEPAPVEPAPMLAPEPAMVQPRPAVKAKPKPPPKPAGNAGPFPIGTWVGMQDGETIEVTLSGTPEELVGKMTTGAVETKFKGSFHEHSGVLKWRDIGDYADATQVFMTKTADGGFNGTFEGIRNDALLGSIVLVTYQ